MPYPVSEVHIVRGANGGAVKEQLAVVIALLDRVVVAYSSGSSGVAYAYATWTRFWM